MRSYNKAVILGRLGREPKNISNDDKCVVVFPVATNEKHVDKATGEVKEYTDWHSVVVYGKQGEACLDQLDKGDRVLVEGKMRVGIHKSEGEYKLPKVEIMAREVSFIDASGREEEE